MIYCSMCGDDAHRGACSPQTLKAAAVIGGQAMIRLLAAAQSASLQRPVADDDYIVFANQPGSRVTGDGDTENNL